MKAVVQRVQRAEVQVEGQPISRIEKGLVTFLGIAKGDTETQVKKLVEKIVGLRIFHDEAGKMNLSLADVGGEHLIVSQFTLLGDSSRGRRPSFAAAEGPEAARALYEQAIEISEQLGIKTSGGKFQAEMNVSLVNHGPVTLILEA